MTPEQIPQELKKILDDDAGKIHSSTGAVMTTLAKILTVHARMVRNADAEHGHTHTHTIE